MWNCYKHIYGSLPLLQLFMHFKVECCGGGGGGSRGVTEEERMKPNLLFKGTLIEYLECFINNFILEFALAENPLL